MQTATSDWDDSDIVASLPVPDRTLPLMLSPRRREHELIPWARANVDRLRASLAKHGALLFRDFGVAGVETFESLVTVLCGPPLPYMERSSPRTQVAGNIYTSTDYPRDQPIVLHNEHSYSLSFPMHIAFYCAEAAQVGGETPVADCRRVFARIPAPILDRFLGEGYLYVRNYHRGIGLSWQEVFQTTEREAVEAYCRENDISWDWDGGGPGILRTQQLRRMAGLHPATGEPSWMNHATFFHFSSLPKEIGDYLVKCYTEARLPNNTYFGNGDRLDPSLVESLREAYNQEAAVFAWREGDILILDNMLAAHGRRPFSGRRRVLTAMAKFHRWADVRPIA